MNTPDFREKELKFEVEGCGFDAAFGIVHLTLNPSYHDVPCPVMICTTVDKYWQMSEPGRFIRLRSSSGTHKGLPVTLDEITVKAKDRKTNTNRKEINLNIGDQGVAASKLLELAHGKPTGVVNKVRETIWFLDKVKVVISLSKMNDDKIYFEVESESTTDLKYFSEIFKESLKLKREPRSLFEIYILPK